MRVGSEYTPDYWAKQVIDEWIVFPYDMRETVEAFQTKLLKEGKSRDHIAKQLSLIKVPQKFIIKYLKK